MPPDEPTPDREIQNEFDLFSAPASEPRQVEKSALPNPVSGPKPTRHFLGWDQPLADAVARHLAGEWTEGLLDLSGLLIVTPTRQSGRRLREALATLAASGGGAVYPPQVVTPEFLVAPERLPDAPEIAAPVDELLAWERVLGSIELARFRDLFPADPLDRGLDWSLRMGDEFGKLRALLGENGLGFEQGAELLQDNPDSGRWGCLVELEHRYLEALDAAQLADREGCRVQASREGVVPEDVREIFVAATPDPLPLALTTLTRVGAEIPVHVLVWAPDALAHQFDEWGRPLPDHWAAKEIPLGEVSEVRQRVHPLPDPAAQAVEAVNLALRHEVPAEFVAFGVPDVTIAPPLLQHLESRGLRGFDPSGEPLRKLHIHELLRCLHVTLSSRTFSALAALTRLAGVAEAVCREKDHLTPKALLVGIDDFHLEHLPDSIESADQLAADRAAAALLGWWRKWEARFQQETPVKALLGFLAEVLGERELDFSVLDDRRFRDGADAVVEVIENVCESLQRFPRSEAQGVSGVLRLALIQLSNARLQEERETGAMDLHGWLELLWESAPHLIVTGFNEGQVPDSIHGDAYLPDPARMTLGLRSNGDRLARDSYLLEALLRSREAQGGRVDLLFGRVGQTMDPLRPSGLLFRCSDEELPARTLELFRKLPPPAPSPAASVPRVLVVPALPEEHALRERISVTKFRNYLECPFRFYLKNALRMDRRSVGEAEMDSRQFGSFFHEIVENYGTTPAINASRDESEIHAFFRDELDRLLTEKFGATLTLPLQIQKAVMVTRLEWVAAVEAQSREDGWVVDPDWVEKKFRFEMNGLLVSGQIDRVERHEDQGVRVLDFKTGVKELPKKSASDYVQRQHLVKARQDDDLVTNPWRFVHLGGVPHRWTDLQVPLYVMALREMGEDGPLSAGYFGLGKDKGSIGLALWEGLDGAVLAASRACAEGVVTAIQDGEFWPPAPRTKFDDFKELGLGDLPTAFDVTALGVRHEPEENSQPKGDKS